MSESTLISPLLDGFTMGQPISDHDGVSCCPAIKEDTDKKYIIKIITIPATQTQMDALMLAGAYKDPADAMDYYRTVGEDVLKEAELLRELSQQEGFLSYEGWQMMPITRKRLGYHVYLVGNYKRTLEKHLRRSPVTQLEAMNLGMDLCQALSVCRQAGSLYVALKPANIFVSDKKQYRIGDLGLVSLDALSYTALPKKYQSAYTPPELFDPMAPLNLTADTYAVGMILYQLYNDGQLPFRDKAPETPLPSPVNADYELAEIIMKAIDPDPAQRWDDPAELGRALTSYMQRNVVNDVPITQIIPLPVQEPAITAENTAPEDVSEALPTSREDASLSEPLPVETSDTVSEPLPTDAPETDIALAPDTEIADVPLEEDVPVSDDPSYSEDEISQVPSDSAATEDAKAVKSVSDFEEAAISEEIPLADYEEADLSPSEKPSSAPTDEFSAILAKAEDLMQHQPPEGVVLPEVPEEADPFAFAKDDTEELDADIPLDPVMEEEPEVSVQKKSQKKFVDPKYKRRTKRLISTLAFLIALCTSGLAGYWYYQNIYLQSVNQLLINGTQDRLTITVDSEAKDSLLKVTCFDSHGYRQTQTLSGGTTIFTDLQPSTLYTIQLEIDGFHKLIGQTSDIFTTNATTNILSFHCAAGKEDGSVILDFTANGELPEEWILHCSAENEEPREIEFTGNSVSVSDLTVGKQYTFTLDAGKKLTLGGEKSMKYVATRLIIADNLTLSSEKEDEITVKWDVPGDVLVENWIIRCYNEKNYDETLTVTEHEAVFTGIDPADGYVIEVVASGMTEPARITVTPNSLRVSQITVDESDPTSLTVNWECAGNNPEGGWLLIYSIDGSEKNVVQCADLQAVITPRIPGGKYALSIQAADGSSVLGGTQTYVCPDAAAFNQFNLSAEQLEVKLLKTPEENGWNAEKLEDTAFTSTFTSGESISAALFSSDSFYLPGKEVEILYMIRDTYGNVLFDLCHTEKVYWKNIWNRGDAKCAELTLPAVPENAGSYTLDLLFDGALAASLPFTIQ